MASRFKYTLYNLCQEARKKRHISGKTGEDENLHEAAVAPPGLRAPHLLGHFHPSPALPDLTVYCRLLPCCSAETTGAALPLAEQGALGSSWWAVLGTAPGCSATSHTSPLASCYTSPLATTLPPPLATRAPSIPHLRLKQNLARAEGSLLQKTLVWAQQ